MSRRFVIFGAVIAIVVAIWSGGWLLIANEVRSQVALASAADGYTAPRLTCAKLDVAGYPFRFNLTCSDAQVLSGDIAFSAPALRVAALVFQPTLFQVFATPPLTIKDAFTGSESSIGWSALEASVRLDNWRLARASVVIEDPAWINTLLTETPIASAGYLELHLVDIADQNDAAAGTTGLAGYAKVTGLAHPAAALLAAEATADLQITGIPADVRTFGEGEPLRRWQEAGGKVVVTAIKASDGDSFANLTGELGLDSGGLLGGAVDITSRGVIERFSGMVAPEMQPLVFGAQASDGSYSQRLMIANGVIFAGLLPISAVPPLF